MNSRLANLSIAIAIALLVRAYVKIFIPPAAIPATWFMLPTNADSETRLALGYAIPFACAETFDLQLISGVSDSLSKELLDSRDEILRLTRTMQSEDALMQVRGIGEKKAAQLTRVLDLTTASSMCSDAG